MDPGHSFVSLSTDRWLQYLRTHGPHSPRPDHCDYTSRCSRSGTYFLDVNIGNLYIYIVVTLLKN